MERSTTFIGKSTNQMGQFSIANCYSLPEGTPKIQSARAPRQTLGVGVSDHEGHLMKKPSIVAGPQRCVAMKNYVC